MSLLLSEECVEFTKSLVNYWASPVDFDSYSDYKQEAIDIQNREVSKKLNRFRSLLFESANRADHEFKFIVLNYLYWLGRKYNQENQYLDFQPHLFNITLNIATELDGLENLQNKIKYNYHIASGHKAKGDNHRKAGKHYREALAIGQTLHWKGSIANPIRNLVEAEFWSHKENKKIHRGGEKNRESN